jgi:N6-adenosine-specific RNA methylase IME4/plasmid stability protein
VTLPPHPAAALFPLMPEAELRALADDIRAHGLAEPVVVHHGQVVDGRNRIAACSMAGVEARTVEWSGEGDPTTWIVSVNLHRRHLTESQRAMIAARLRPALPTAQGERRDLGRTSTSIDVEVPPPSPRPDRPGAAAPEAARPGTSARAAELLRVSEPTVVRASAVVARGTPALVEAVDAGRVPVSTAAAVASLPPPIQDALVQKVSAASNPEEARRIMRQGLKEERDRKKEDMAAVRRAELAQQPIAMPSIVGIDLRLADVAEVARDVRGAGLVHADPNWNYQNQRLNGTAGNHYELAGMPAIVANLDAAFDAAADDCYMLLWATLPLLGEWFAAARDGGLRWDYKSGGVWGKTGRLGIGFHWRGDAELLLLYVKGSPRPRIDTTSNLYVSDRGEHSEKPEAWLRTLVRTFSDPGALVLDLYAGLAPMARACRETGRRYVGAEKDEGRRTDALLALRAAGASQ